MAKNLFSILSVLLALGCCLVFGAEESAIPNNNQRNIRGQVQKEALNQDRDLGAIVEPLVVTGKGAYVQVLPVVTKTVLIAQPVVPEVVVPPVPVYYGKGKGKSKAYYGYGYGYNGYPGYPGYGGYGYNGYS